MGSVVRLWVALEHTTARLNRRIGQPWRASAGVGSSIRPDMLLIRHPSRALVLECKWSAEPSYVGRDGFHQASSYALDTLNGLASEVWSLVVGPQEIIPTPNLALAERESMKIVLGSTAAQELGQIVRLFFQGNP